MLLLNLLLLVLGLLLVLMLLRMMLLLLRSLQLLVLLLLRGLPGRALPRALHHCPAPFALGPLALPVPRTTLNHRQLRYPGLESAENCHRLAQLLHPGIVSGLCRYCVGDYVGILSVFCRYFVGILSETMSDYPAILFAPLC